MPVVVIALIVAAGLAVLTATATAAQTGEGTVEDSTPRPPFLELYQRASRIYGVPWRWLMAFGYTESDNGEATSVAYGLENPGDREGSKSSDGLSWGVMQMTERTANDLRPGTTFQELNNPETSILLGAQYVRQLMDRFPGNREYTVRSYNGGPGFMNTARGQSDTPKYYARWLKKLDLVMSLYPGNELEEG
jgi:membrane-bound lytic murein transglycosylase MltF